jgi:hypothetical protein
MIRWLCVVAAGLVMGGCGGPMVFEKAGATQTDLEQDRYDCQVQIERGPYAMAFAQDPMANLMYPAQARRELQACLTRKGWVRRDG